jgi:predicted lipoprotein with Yx(FWY)xxD motif
MRSLLALFVVAIAASIAGCSAAVAQPRASECQSSRDCTLVDVCGCSCHAAPGHEPPVSACSEACPGHPCEGHRAVCRAGRCAMD